MALRFRRRIKIMPGVHLNVSRSGISTSIGVRGASFTFGKQGTYMNTGIPGSGISWRQRIDTGTGQHQDYSSGAEATTMAPAPPVHHHHLPWWKILLWFVTASIAGKTQNDTVMGIFWAAWFIYWGFLLVRRLARLANHEAASPALPEQEGQS